MSVFVQNCFLRSDRPCPTRACGGHRQTPVVMSTGYTSMEELDESVKLLRDKGVKDLALLHCITYYTEALEPRLAFMETMLHQRDRYDVVGGFSDNNDGIEVPTLAVALGASIVEKHIILDEDKAAKRGYDAQFSLSATNFLISLRRFVELKQDSGMTCTQHFRKISAASCASFIRGRMRPLAGFSMAAHIAREGNLRFRRSLFAVKDIKRRKFHLGQCALDSPIRRSPHEILSWCNW